MLNLYIPDSLHIGAIDLHTGGRTVTWNVFVLAAIIISLWGIKSTRSTQNCFILQRKLLFGERGSGVKPYRTHELKSDPIWFQTELKVEWFDSTKTIESVSDLSVNV